MPHILMRAPFLLLALALLTVAVPGCLGTDDSTSQTALDPASDAGGPAAGTDGQATTPLPAEAPAWEIGRWWAWTHDDGESTFEWTLAVTEDRGDAWLLAPDAVEPARFNAMFDWYVFGEMSKDRLTDEDAGGLVFYDFPLSDGKTWTSTFAPGVLDWEVTHTATYAPTIATAMGLLPGYTIEAVVNGTTFFAYDYVPEIGWFSQLTNHVLPEEGGQGEVDWTYETTGWGTGYTGTLHQATAELLVDTFHEIDVHPERPEANPAPHASFTVTDEADALFAVAGTYAIAGASQTTLVDPEQGTHQLTAVSPGLDGTFTGMGHFLEPVAGQWEVTLGGAGVDTEGWVAAWQVVDEPIELG